jgi:hypothetical protein
MPITPFLNGERFDLEGERVLRVAFEMVCIALRTGDCDDGVKQAIATKLIALAKAGERNPNILCEEVLKDIRRPQQWAASEAARSSVLGEICRAWRERQSFASNSAFSTPAVPDHRTACRCGRSSYACTLLGPGSSQPLDSSYATGGAFALWAGRLK